MAKICEDFRAQIASFLIEPDAQTLEKWQPHLNECADCQAFVAENQEQQQLGQNLTNNLIDYVPSPPMQSKRAPRYYLVAACVIFCFAGLYIASRYITMSISQQIDSVIAADFNDLSQEQHKVVHKALSKYGEGFTVEMRQIAKNLDQTEKLLQQKFIPLLRVRVIVNCRLYLHSSSLSTFNRLCEDNDLGKVEHLFSRALKNISTDEQSRLVLAQFFQKSAVHLRNIKAMRQELHDKIQKINLGNGEAVIWKVENVFITKGVIK
ncbi:hypothetical protein [Candidatus Uabimicrobium amorphum]|uniref:Zinc-finger domain-containing protein n=1 Tax=Uabimicrobium amorphum TaxID=2596890 RepID=A0A5S9IUQ7_UABAM|nr:hypothetical protein [Candidatus Uabimicrobium amorphum]BBM86955.1 hypothetical protein UABAM_05357 [Candidatus Uabimicrobium amorphum]